MSILTDLAHVPWAVGIQLIGVGLFAPTDRVKPPHWWICGLGGFSIMFVREVTQAEYRFIELHGHRRANMPDLQGFDITLWNAHSIAETVYAALAVAAIAMTATALCRKLSSWSQAC